MLCIYFKIRFIQLKNKEKWGWGFKIFGLLFVTRVDVWKLLFFMYRYY